MKRDLGKRTYSEMYLITKENKNLLDKCIKGLNENLTSKDKIVVNKLDKQSQTSNQQTDPQQGRATSRFTRGTEGWVGTQFLPMPLCLQN